jgi:hypothetical protein
MRKKKIRGCGRWFAALLCRASVHARAQAGLHDLDAWLGRSFGVWLGHLPARLFFFFYQNFFLFPIFSISKK